MYTKKIQETREIFQVYHLPTAQTVMLFQITSCKEALTVNNLSAGGRFLGFF